MHVFGTHQGANIKIRGSKMSLKGRKKCTRAVPQARGGEVGRVVRGGPRESPPSPLDPPCLLGVWFRWWAGCVRPRRKPCLPAPKFGAVLVNIRTGFFFFHYMQPAPNVQLWLRPKN